MTERGTLNSNSSMVASHRGNLAESGDGSAFSIRESRAGGGVEGKGYAGQRDARKEYAGAKPGQSGPADTHLSRLERGQAGGKPAHQIQGFAAEVVTAVVRTRGAAGVAVPKPVVAAPLIISGHGKPYTDDEVAWLRLNYRRLLGRGCAAVLKRAPESINMKAHELGLTEPRQKRERADALAHRGAV